MGDDAYIKRSSRPPVGVRPLAIVPERSTQSSTINHISISLDEPLQNEDVEKKNDDSNTVIVSPDPTACVLSP